MDPDKVLMDISNICEGALAEELQEHYRGVLSKLRPGEKGSIAINITISRMKDAVTIAEVGYSIASKTPARKRGSLATIVEDGGGLALKVDPPRPSNVTQLKIVERSE